MTVYFVEDDRAQAMMFEIKLKNMFGDNVKYKHLEHFYELSMQTFPADSLIVLDYCFKHGFRSSIAFDLISDKAFPTFLYTSCSKSEVEKDIQKQNIKWPKNMSYRSKGDFTIFNNIKNFFLKDKFLVVT